MRTPGYGVTITDLERYHRERMMTAINMTGETGTPLVDVLAFETVPDLLEAQAIANVLDALHREKRVERPIDSWVTFTCPDSKTVDNGDLFSSCIAALCSSKYITGVGINCTAPELAVSLIRTAKRTITESGTSRLIVCYPNSGEQYLARALKPGETEHWRSCTGQDDRSFSEMADEWQHEGCHIIGGCCRITAEDIQILSDQFA
jgi:homocysteine S-methyltransferase